MINDKVFNVYINNFIQINKGLAFTDDTVKEFAKGFELMKALKFSDSVCFDHSGLGMFLNPLQMRSLHISHIT